jgi:hypothetical protein
MNPTLKIGLVSALALATAAPAFAQYQSRQPQPPGPQYQPTPQYQRELDHYEDEQSRYEARKEAYDASLDDYAAARASYERRRSDWVAARNAYERRYGAGTYVRAYGPEPTWDDAYWQGRRDAGHYGVNSSYTRSDCASNNNSTVAGGIIGALAGAALGSNVAANGRGTEGAVLGAVVGGAIGASVGHSRDRYKCDGQGPYYSYNDTIAYRESPWDRHRNSGRYSYQYYVRHGCRLAPAPIDADARDYRYVRVCPDGDGHYRITG